MAIDVTEKGLETLIIDFLVNNAGYVQNYSAVYDREHNDYIESLKSTIKQIGSGKKPKPPKIKIVFFNTIIPVPSNKKNLKKFGTQILMNRFAYLAASARTRVSILKASAPKPKIEGISNNQSKYIGDENGYKNKRRNSRGCI